MVINTYKKVSQVCSDFLVTNNSHIHNKVTLSQISNQMGAWTDYTCDFWRKNNSRELWSSTKLTEKNRIVCEINVPMSKGQCCSCDNMWLTRMRGWNVTFFLSKSFSEQISFGLKKMLIQHKSKTYLFRANQYYQ